jgi:hypothetical protein
MRSTGWRASCSPAARPPPDVVEEAAAERGANAVIAMRFDCNEIGDIMSEVAAHGTAVRVRRAYAAPVG